MLELLNAPTVLIFLGTSSVCFLLFLYAEGASGAGSWLGPLWRQGGRARLGEVALSALPRLGAPLMPTDELEQSRLVQRLVLAGMYSRSALPRYLGVRVVLMVAAVVVGTGIGLARVLPPVPALLLGSTLLALALVGPGLWLDWLKSERQRSLRHALPDAIDTLTICLEGGLSLYEALRRVNDELETVHPLLADEFAIVQREVLLGLSPGEALRKFAARTDLHEARNLASVVLHAERYGVGMAQAMRVEVDAMRQERRQRAEEMAQKAAVKILFPTLLLIFPALFIILLGPAVHGLMKTLAHMNPK